jgi:hypothetical protein
MIMHAQVQALQDEVRSLIAKLDESEARIDTLEALLREALAWAPRAEHGWTETAKFCDLGNRISAALEGKP